MKMRNIYLDKEIYKFNFEIGGEVLKYRLTINEANIIEYIFLFDNNNISHLKMKKISLLSIEKVIEYIGLAYYKSILSLKTNKSHSVIFKFNYINYIYGCFRKNIDDYYFEIWDDDICLTTIILK